MGRGEGVIRDTLSTEPTITCGQIIMVHSFFSECGDPARKEPVADWRSWSHWHHACTHSSADEGPQLMLLLIIVMSGGTDFTDLYLMGVSS